MSGIEWKEAVDQQRRAIRHDFDAPPEGNEDYLPTNWTAEFTSPQATSSLPVYIRAADGISVVRVEKQWIEAEGAVLGSPHSWQTFTRFRELPTPKVVETVEREVGE